MWRDLRNYEKCSIRRLPSSASRPMFAAFNQVVPIKGAAPAPDADEQPRTAPPIATPNTTETIQAEPPAQHNTRRAPPPQLFRAALLDLTLASMERELARCRTGRIV